MSSEPNLGITRREAVINAGRLLESHGIDNAASDAKQLFLYVTSLTQKDLLFDGHLPVQEKQQLEFNALLQRRLSHEPLQYIIGTQEFMGLEFQVNPAVLIPRQDTEVLVEEVLKYSTDKKVLDLCTGSGCIAISIAKLGKPASVFAGDLSTDALEVAKENANRLQAKVSFVQSDLFEQFEDSFDIIVSNPPYIESAEIECLMEEVKDYEPRMALDGAEDGLKFYQSIIEEAANHLVPGGRVLFEIGCNQAQAVSELFRENGFENIKVIKDYAGLDRVVKAQWI